MASQPLAFAELLAGGVLVTAALTGSKLADVVAGKASPIRGLAAGGGTLLSGTAAQAEQPGAGAGSGGVLSPHNLGRTDMGVDYSGSGSVSAIGDAIITRVSPQGSGTGWPGAGDAGRGNRGALIVYRLTSGPYAGRHVYVAENIDPAPGLAVGQRVRAGDTIANARGAFPFLEIGFAADAAGRTLAAATTGYREGQATSAGQAFKAFLHRLGFA